MRHARSDYNRIQDPAGLIPYDMPVFLLLGKDIHAAATVRYYADRVEISGGDPEIVRLAREHAALMEALPVRKQPDVPWSPPPAAARDWLVWSNEHGAWWGPNSAGYFYKVEQAGRYTFAEALSHCRSRSRIDGELPPELPVPSPELEQRLSGANP